MRGRCADDLNVLSNFVADAPRVLGFDPFAKLADWLEREQRCADKPAAVAVPPGMKGPQMDR